MSVVLGQEVAKSAWENAPLADSWGLKVTVVKVGLVETLVGLPFKLRELM
ncbi:MAG: hypothetical protein ICV54_16060 [Nostoc sp. C3-bin3]|nr:hypothetical protein [Nostoc sp. C3-bin3]